MVIFRALKKLYGEKNYVFKVIPLVRQEIPIDMIDHLRQAETKWGRLMAIVDGTVNSRIYFPHETDHGTRDHTHYIFLIYLFLIIKFNLRRQCCSTTLCHVGH